MRSKIEERIRELRRELDLVLRGGWRNDDFLDVLVEYAPSKGTGYNATKAAKEVIESLIVEAEKELASLSKESALENARRAYEYCGAKNATTEDYIKALDACRPWVIRSNNVGGFLVPHMSPTHTFAMFPCRESAESYLSRHAASDCWEIVQWEGNQ